MFCFSFYKKNKIYKIKIKVYIKTNNNNNTTFKMEIRIFGMTVRLEIIIITLIVGMIMGGHLLCACAKVPLSEAFGLEGMTEGAANNQQSAVQTPPVIATGGHEATGETANENQPQATVVPTTSGGSKPGNKISAETISQMSTMLPNVLNGFQDIMSGIKPPGETDAFTDYSTYKGGDNNSDVASSWINKADTYSKNLGYQQTAQKANMYTGTQVPLPDGELFFFQNNQFKPECCPSPYSASTGCACMSKEQIAYLNSRGGNRTCDSEF